MSECTRDLQATIGRSAVLALVVATSCGWRFGHPASAPLTVGEVAGGAVQPGLRAALEDSLTVAARRRGIPSGGPVVRVTVLSSDDRIQAGAAGGTAWEASLTVAAAIDGQSCDVEVSGRRTWVAPAGDLDAVPAARADAHRLLASEVADRTLDALLAECR